MTPDGLESGQVRFWRVPAMEGLELIHGSYSAHAYPRHTHDEYTISIITRGAETFEIGGLVQQVGVGGVIMLNPGQPHSNYSSAPGGYAFRTFYVPRELMPVASGSTIRRGETPLFRSAIYGRCRFFLPLLRLHKQLEREPSAIDQRVSLTVLFRQLLAAYGTDGETLPSLEHRAVRRAREYLDIHFMEPVRLEQLGQAVRLSPFHLLRTFSEQVGMSPAEYQTAVRLSHAKHLLRQGCRIAEVAADVGFVDQSHLTRRFKNAMGVTPGQYLSARAA